ncbi:MAG: BhlA/UviB family holin-like peptide [Clostridia bacterium]
MWTEIANLAVSNGIFAALFVALLLYTLKDSANREKKYTETIKKLSCQLDVVSDIKKSVETIQNELKKQSEEKAKKLVKKQTIVA